MKTHAERKWPKALLPYLMSMNVLVAASCCPFGVWHMRVTVADYEDQGYGNPPPAFQVGDTIRFLAEEGYFEATCRTPAPSSDRAPDEYGWEIIGAGAELIGDGFVAMRDTGEVQLRVSTSHVEDMIALRIVRRVAAIRLTPDSVVLNVGDTISFLVEALDEHGDALRELNRASDLLRLHGDPSDWANPIAANQADSDGVHFLWRAFRPGVVTLRAGIAVYGAEPTVVKGRLEVRSH